MPKSHSQGVAQSQVTPFPLHHTPQLLTEQLWATPLGGWEGRKLIGRVAWPRCPCMRLPVCVQGHLLCVGMCGYIINNREPFAYLCVSVSMKNQDFVSQVACGSPHVI